MMLDGVMDVVFSRAKAVSVDEIRGSGEKEKSQSKWSTRGVVAFCVRLQGYWERLRSVHRIDGFGGSW